MRARTNQGGWIVNFVVVGAVLVLGLLAGLYYVKSREAARETSSVATDTSQSDQGSSDQKNTDDQWSGDDKASSDNASDKAADGESRDDTAANTNDEQDGDIAVETPGDMSDAELPQSGPVDTLAQLTGATLLTITIVSYVQSRRSL